MAALNTPGPWATPPKPQAGQGLVSCLVGMSMGLTVVMAAMGATTWMQRTQTLLQQHLDTHQRMHTAFIRLQDRALRAGAPALVEDASGAAFLQSLGPWLSGDDKSLQLMHWRNLTPTDCLGHNASTLDRAQDDFRRNTQQELVCKDLAPGLGNFQSLIDQTSDFRVRYAQSLTDPQGPNPSMQWLSAAQVTDWRAVRALQICLQLKTQALTMNPPTLACASARPLPAGSVAWRAVVFLRHAGA